MVLIVNGERIEDAEMEQEAERLRPEYERTFADMKPDEREEQLLEWSRENVIERVLVNQEAKKRNFHIADTQIEKALDEIQKQRGGKKPNEKSFDELREQIAQQMKTEKLIEIIRSQAPEPSDEQIKEYYEENKERFRTPERIKVSHIVKHPSAWCSPPQAESIIKEAKAKLDAGESFELLVGRYSDCSDNDGSLGYIVRGQMVEEFEDVIFNMDEGQVSDIFQTRFGFHIAKVYDRKKSVLQKIGAVKQQIEDLLKQNFQTEAVEKFVDKLKAEAEIKKI